LNESLSKTTTSHGEDSGEDMVKMVRVGRGQGEREVKVMKGPSLPSPHLHHTFTKVKYAKIKEIICIGEEGEGKTAFFSPGEKSWH
jgi:hypothetical protein